MKSNYIYSTFWPRDLKVGREEATISLEALEEVYPQEKPGLGHHSEKREKRFL